MLDILWDNFPAFVSGAGVTLLIAVCCWVIGLSLGFILGFLAWKRTWLTLPVYTVGVIVSSIPVLTLLFWFHYPLQSSLGAVVNPLLTSIFVFSVVNIMMVADTVLQSAKQLPNEYSDLAYLHGLSPREATFKIEFPLVLRSSIPTLLKIQVVVLHMTLFASLISVDELFRMAQRVNAQEYQPTAIYTLLAGFYLILSLPIILLAEYLRKRFSV